MKKLFYLSMLLLFLAPINIFATNDINISCAKTKLNKNQETMCTLSVSNLNFTATDITGGVQVGEHLSIVSSSYDRNIWMSLDKNFSVSDINLIREEVSKKSSFTVAIFKIRASSNATGNSNITFKNVTIGDEDYQSIVLGTKILPISFNSNVNTLSSLSVSGYEISFSSNKINYSITVDEESVTVNATPTHQGAKVSGIGVKKLNYGSNTVNVVVTAEDGSTKMYVINVTRKDDRSTNNNLRSLSVSNSNIKFNKDTTTYNIDVDSDVDKVTIKAEVEDKKATFVKGFEPREVNLNYGVNKIQIKVKSENEKEKVYTINVTRKDDRSSNNDLKSLIINPGKIKFDKKETEYTVNIPFEVNKITIKAAPSDSKSKVEVIEPSKLEVGENYYIIKVTAENESVKEYKIKVIKDEEVIITNSNKLDNIEIEGYDLDFESDIYTYIVKTKKSKLNIKVKLADKNSTYKINGNENLKNGSVISIVVTDKNGNNGIYKINIEADTFDIIKLLLIISIILNIIFLGIIFILKNNKKNIDENSFVGSTKFENNMNEN